jgi:hypothetical protein
MRRKLVMGLSVAVVLMAAGAVEAQQLRIINLFNRAGCGTTGSIRVPCGRTSFLAAFRAAQAQARITRLIVARFTQPQCVNVVSPSQPC